MHITQYNSIQLQMFSPTILNFQDIRSERQQFNDMLVYEDIKQKQINQNVNQSEYKRTIESSGITQEHFLEKCQEDDIFAKVVSGRISKKASRQGNKDEELQINTINKSVSKFGINVKSLSKDAFRPTKSGDILSKKEYNEKHVSKNDCYKSFDGIIDGKINGWIFAKVVFGEGGHQDNVFEEADALCNWIIQYDKTEYFIILIDTNLDAKFEALRSKYQPRQNILIGNHITIQELLFNLSQ